MAAIRSLARDPLLHFLLLAGMLFVVNYYVSALSREKIVIDRETVEYLIQERERLELRTLSPDERRDLIKAHVEDELLYREAYQRGLDRSDSRMRRNLILKMRGLLIDRIADPSEADLRAFYQRHRDRFVQPATWTLDHIYFSDLRKVPGDLLQRLNRGADPSTFGQYLPGYGRRMSDLTRPMLVRAFGVDTAAHIIETKDADWHGPWTSTVGAHFVRVAERFPDRALNYEEAQPYLENQWMLAQSRKVVEDEIDRLLNERYEVVIEGEQMVP